MPGLSPGQAPLTAAQLLGQLAALGITVTDAKLVVTGSADATKTLVFQVDTQATTCDLIIDVGAQTADRTLTLPVLTANDTLAALGVAQTFSATQTFTGAIAQTGATTISTGTGTFTHNGAITIADAKDITVNATTGTKIGTAVTQKIGFWNATPIVQPSGAAQAAVATTGATNTTPYGFTTAAQADAIVTLLNAIRTALVNAGLMKGSA